MTEKTLDNLSLLIARAAMDGRFYQDLKTDPIKTAKEQAGIDLEPENAQKLSLIWGDLDRMGGVKGLSKEDAGTWAVGLVVTKVVGSWIKDWAIRVTNVKRSRLF